MPRSMRLSLQPNGQAHQGQHHSYIVALPNETTAILDEVAGQGWHLSIVRQGRLYNRGMFGSTADILALLESEFYPPLTSRGTSL